MVWTKEQAKQYAKDWYIANREQQLARAKLRNAANPEARRKSWRKVQLRKYGMTIEDYENLFEKQHGRCAICHTPADVSPKGILVVDHCHDTNKVRGLLCHYCNLLLGLAKDNETVLVRAVRYLSQ